MRPNLCTKKLPFPLGYFRYDAPTTTSLRTSTGLIPTGHEGYVVINKHGKDAVKIVDREEFSRANFSDDILKGWDK